MFDVWLLYRRLFGIQNWDLWSGVFIGSSNQGTGWWGIPYFYYVFLLKLRSWIIQANATRYIWLIDFDADVWTLNIWNIRWKLLLLLNFGILSSICSCLEAIIFCKCEKFGLSVILTRNIIECHRPLQKLAFLPLKLPSIYQHHIN